MQDLADAHLLLRCGQRAQVPLEGIGGVQGPFAPVIGWRPWQGMSGFDGPPSHVMGSCSGRVVTSVDALPPRYLGWTQRFHADVLADPLKLLASAWATS